MKTKKKIKNILKGKKDEWDAKFVRSLPSVAFEAKTPVGNGQHREYYFSCTEWANGEGWDINIIHHYDGKDIEDKRLSLHSDELWGILACLNHLKQFDE